MSSNVIEIVINYPIKLQLLKRKIGRRNKEWMEIEKRDRDGEEKMTMKTKWEKY